MENMDTENEELTKGDKSGNLTVRRNKKIDFIAKIGCVLIAFMLWFYAAESDTAVYEEFFSSVPVEIINNSGFSVLSGDDVTIDVTVSGKRNVIKRLSRTEIKAYIDISSITSAGKYKFDVQYELPNGVTLSKSTVNSVTVYVDNTTTVSVPVKVNVTNYMLEDGYELGLSDIVTDVKNITVTGPESVLAEIASARLNADIGHVSRTVTYSGNIALIDASGNEVTNSYIKTNVSYVTATIPVYKYRDVPLNVIYKHGYFTPSNSVVTVEPQSIRIRGEADEVDAVKLEYEIDEKKINGDVTYTVSVDLPDTVQNVSMTESAVISIELKGVSTRTISIYSLNVINPNGLSYDPIAVPINVTLRGDSSVINYISSMSITATVDLSAQERANGTVMLPVTFTFASTYSGKVYELGTYSVSVKING